MGKAKKITRKPRKAAHVPLETILGTSSMWRRPAEPEHSPYFPFNEPTVPYKRFADWEKQEFPKVGLTEEQAFAYPERFSGWDAIVLHKAGISARYTHNCDERLTTHQIIEQYIGPRTENRPKPKPVEFSQKYSTLSIDYFKSRNLTPETVNPYDFLPAQSVVALLKRNISPEYARIAISARDKAGVRMNALEAVLSYHKLGVKVHQLHALAQSF